MYLAMSCLQGRMAKEAIQDLLALAPDGIQLTPGNIPDIDFEEWFRAQNIPYLIHHGFDWERRKRKVWEERRDFSHIIHHPEDAYRCVALGGASVHPPICPDVCEDWMYCGHVLEVMYGTYGLGNGDEVELAMDRRIPLAVDVSHIYIQIMQGTMSEKTWFRLQDYDNIAEVHASANNGLHDTHRPLGEDSFGIAWAREKAETGTPLILECYMHKLNESERMSQLEVFR